MNKSVFIILVGSCLILSISTNGTAKIDVIDHTYQVGPDQSGYNLTIHNSPITTYQNTTTNITVSLFLDDSPVTDSYFDIEELNLDIGESQFNLNNGTYKIQLTTSALGAVPPGSYTPVLIALHDSTRIEQSFGLNILTDDNTPPTLNIIEPSGTNISDSIFKLKLQVTDDYAWMDINITLVNHTFLYLSRNSQGYNSSDLFYNQTYLYVEMWINLGLVSNAEGNTIEIVVRDSGFNLATHQINLVGDFTRPEVQILSHSDQQRIYNREVELSWEIVDASPIADQTLLLNDREFLPDDKQLDPNQRSITFFLPIDENSPATIDLTLIVEDSSGNTNSVTITLIYDTSQQQDNFQIEITPVTIALIVSIIAFLGALTYFLIQKSETDQQETAVKLSRKQKKVLQEQTQKLKQKLLQSENKTDRSMGIISQLESLANAKSFDEYETTILEIRNHLDYMQIEDEAENLQEVIDFIKSWIKTTEKQMR